MVYKVHEWILEELKEKKNRIFYILEKAFCPTAQSQGAAATCRTAASWQDVLQALNGFPGYRELPAIFKS